MSETKQITNTYTFKHNAFVSPIYNVRRIPIEKITPNDYNPNRGDQNSQKLLYDSLKEDGITSCIVCYRDTSKCTSPDDEENVKYVIVDGFHRYAMVKDHPDLYEREGGCLPVAVIDKDLTERMASTIRHNRARGEHDIDLMANMLAELHKLGRSDNWIMKHLGMDKDEVLRLKQFSGLTSIFKDGTFSESEEEFPKVSHKIVSNKYRVSIVEDNSSNDNYSTNNHENNSEKE